MSFLIVDDSPQMRRVIRRVVSDLAGEINECGDGAEAFSAYQRLRPEWVLMDVEMREKDGLTATREIREAFPVARVVIVTKHGDEAIREAAAGAGACGYVVKENLLALRDLLSDPAQGCERMQPEGE